jgi:hypothetical protein
MFWQRDCHALEKGNAMNMHVDIEGFRRAVAPKKIGLLRRMIGFLVRVLSGAKGDQGGWEGGARGL